MGRPVIGHGSGFMKSRWDEADARSAVDRYGALGVSEDLALRTYSARLLGADPSLVLHGGGNTSVKSLARDVFGEEMAVLCVKGSGWDLAAIEPPGHPAVRLAPLLRLRTLERLSDEDMVSAQRQNLLDSAAPNPSVETLLHAFIGEKFIEHTHAMAVLALANQPDAESLITRVYGDRVACVPYVMPGFALAKAAADAFDARPGLEGIVLLNHGLFSFGAAARQSYERMIDLVEVAEAFIAKTSRVTAPAPRATEKYKAADILPVLRGALARGSDGRGPSRWIFDLRATPEIMALVGDTRLDDWAGRGVATPDHVIRTKRHPLVLRKPSGDLQAWRTQAESALGAYIADYDAYFARNAARAGGGKVQLDPLPRLVAIAGVGLVGVGANAGEAAVAADIAQSWAATLLRAEAVGRFVPLGEGDTFDMEYWSLEQAKLGKARERRLERHVVLVTGAGGAIGAATAQAFAAEGAQVALLDLDGAAAERAARDIDRHALALACDVTDGGEVVRAFDAVCARFGGVDIVVSNAGAATSGMMEALSSEALRASFDLNFFAHQSVAQAAVRVMRAQSMGGVLLFNASKQAVNPGPDFGAYGAPKAALLALMRQYALEHGADGVRVNAVNPDRIRSGLLSEVMIGARSAARGLSAEAYMAGNLLRLEVTAADVARAFVFAALMEKTTGAVLTVDGGNVAAMMR
jgi:rhamnose utilization protein RhaD (predicted bifunctional aldolase and dehydrogenase)/NAD(P)-dependent dehydrogenase (short-subunit alcohol dehydrogenase family)